LTPAETAETTLSQVAARNARVRPDQLAFVEAASGERLTFAEYDDVSTRMAHAILARGWERGDRVALQVPDGPFAHALLLGCEKAGQVGVGVGARAGARERDQLVARTRARTLLTDPAAVLATSPAEPSSVRPFDDDELWFLNSTSGTTGLPKCVMHHQRRWFAFHDLAQRVAQFTPEDVFLSALPMPFGFGLWTSHFSPGIVGAPCVVVEQFTAELVLDAIERFRVTVLAAVSSQFVMMLEAPSFPARDLSSLGMMFTGGEMVPYERAKDFEDRTGAAVLQFYGSNETGALSGTTPEDPQEKRLRTAGRVIPEMHVRLLDPDTDADITPAGRPGVPAGKGPTLCLGYWDDADANRALFTDDGWMRMGDLATIDDDGYLTVVGRTSDIVIRGGKNISAAQVEDEVAAHPAVAICAVVPVADDTLGERVCACVELRPGHTLDLDELRSHLEARGTGKELWPERLLVLDALPRSSGGKIAKADLRTLAASGFGDDRRP
jgi:acyl-CoA synthetase